jgi:hypothetical protein
MFKAKYFLNVCQYLESQMNSETGICSYLMKSMFLRIIETRTAVPTLPQFSVGPQRVNYLLCSLNPLKVQAFSLLSSTPFYVDECFSFSSVRRNRKNKIRECKDEVLNEAKQYEFNS